MSFTSTNNLYGFPQPLSKVFPAPIIAQRAPQTSDFQYPLGQEWVDASGQNAYILVNVTANSATWAEQGGVSGPIDTLTADSGGAIGPTGGTVDLLGTANEITTTGSGHQIVWSLPTTLIAPGTAEITGLLTADAGITSSGGALTLNSGTNAINISNDASATTINMGTGAAVKTITIGSTNSTSTTTVACGTGGVAIGTSANAHTSTLGSTNSTSTTVVQAGSGGITLTGAVTSANAVTVTAGNITATNGNLVMGTAGNKIIVPTGSNASAGTSGAMSGTPGAVTVATTACSATAKVFYARATAGGTLGNVSITAQDGTGFTLTSTANETSTFNWWIINA